MKEIWKPIENYPQYFISNYGRVYSKYYNKILKNSYSKTHGYYIVGLNKNKKKKIFRVHRLIAEAFIPNPNNKPCINHKNGIRTDNRIENLEWCTHKENIKHASNILNSVFPRSKNKPIGVKMNWERVNKLRYKYSENRNKTYQQIADEFNISKKHVIDILKNKRWKIFY